ncbi:glycoside hydrolase N-terminal domain-containing protein [Paenibacillus filicis]|uniref:Glycoside hydrolase N-terminal domain-containing protein n=1 Tax=Paenibacillus gyeongsangnamensis TaxID=3388067 RepID=A0ABT4Q5S5_9BACL|nr:glycoside hydrolase N-terminal domain-containing protein [Paenibacillus filicis]MCZ8512191.1 glycoside hydrolase N-terminal domain-containing protein [Paenibacillus filicis]
MKASHVLTLQYPASWFAGKWKDALPAGNGTIGAGVYGGVCTETILLNHEDLWFMGRTPELPDVSGKLPEVRKLLLEGRAKEADRLLANELKYKGYEPKIASPLPLGDLKVTMPGKNAFLDYSRSLHMETGEIKVIWLDGEIRYERALFVSRSDDMIVYEIRADKLASVSAAIQLDIHDIRDIRYPKGGQPQAIPLPVNVEQRGEGSYLFYAAENDDGTDFGAVAKVIHHGGSIEHVEGAISAQGADSILVCLKLFVKGERKKDWTRLAESLDMADLDYDRLLASHAKLHGSLFQTMELDLGADPAERVLSNEELLLKAYNGVMPLAMVEKMWAYGRYLLISSSREGGHPCHLYGLWCGEYNAMWAFNMSNENLQMIYWQALSGNMPELMLTVFDYFDGMLDDFRKNARQLYGCAGIYIPAPTVPGSGLLKHALPHIIHWTGGAGWIAQHYYDYYLHTGDQDFLRDRVLPFLMETARFYESFFTLDEKGYFVSSPSNSPENTPGNYLDAHGKGASMGTTMNATMDFAIAKEVLTNLVEGATAAGMYTDEIAKWETMLSRIPPYQLNEDGAVREWMHPFYNDNYHHRHQSHLYGIFPGIEVAKDEDPDLFQAFVTAIKKRLVIGIREQTGWSLAHMSSVYARMGEGELAEECLRHLSRSCVINNFFTLHNDWRDMGIGVQGGGQAPFQIDANMGWSAAVQEMLMFSRPGQITILPALPKRWEQGCAGPLLARGGIEVTSTRGGAGVPARG